MKYRKIVIAVLVVCICLCIGFVYWKIFAKARSLDIDQNQYYRVAVVLDGDTFKAEIDDQIVTIRLLGLNAPETIDPRRDPECYGAEASKKMKEMLTGRSVKLVFNPDREMQDRYGRYLMYAFRDDGLFINSYLLKAGYAREYTVGRPYQHQELFRNIEAEARVAQAGLWGHCIEKQQKTSL